MKLPEETLEWFNNDELRARTFYEKYALRDELGEVVELTPDKMWARVATEISSVEDTQDKHEKWYMEFYDLLKDFKFVPGGRILFGAGQVRRSTLLNCYFIPIREDSIEGIFTWCREAARTYSYGGGVGTDISILRPKGDPVNNSAIYSTGAVSFMDLMSKTTGTIGQAGRRGALMITIDVSHPDIFEFLDVKNDPERLSVKHANISVKVSHEFMTAVENDGLFKLKFNGKVYKTVQARDIWDKLVQSAWDSAEPGLIFWDNIKAYSPTEYNGMEVTGVNPCVTGDTRVYTEQGVIQIKDLVNDSIGLSIDNRITGRNRGRALNVWSNGIKPVFHLETIEGYKLKVTEDHEVFTERGKVAVKDLIYGDKIQILNTKGGFGDYGNREFGEVLGYVVGDGWFSGDRVHTGFWMGDRDLVSSMLANCNSFFQHREFQIPSVIEERDEQRISSKRIKTLFEAIGVTKETKLEVPEAVFQGSQEFQAGYLRGLFSADGTVYGSSDKGVVISLTSISKNLIDDIQMLLLNFGIVSRQYQGHPKRHTLIKGDWFDCKPTYRLNISKDNLNRFLNEIGFLNNSPKTSKLISLLSSYGKRGTYKEKFYARFKGLQYLGKEEVFDLTESESHSFIANGLTVSNCSEQALEDYGCCCLGNINLSAYVWEDEDDLVKWNDLNYDLMVATRFLDNVLTYNEEKHPLKAQSEASFLSRRIGVGFTGLGDMLIKMGLKYDSEEAIEFVDRLFAFIKDSVYRASVNLAKEKGPARGFDSDHHFNTFFMDELEDDLLEDIEEYGLRNCCLLTVAPVGSGSILAGSSSGVEPIFARSYKRRSESLSQEEFTVYHPLVKAYIDASSQNSEDALPDIFVTAHEIEPMKRVEMQATIQKHIDSCISSTINLPEDVSLETVGDIYMKAWKSGCKGITVYREGSREGILITEEKAKVQKEDVKVTDSTLSDKNLNLMKDRPKVLEGFTESVKTDKGNLYVTVNSQSDRPVEVFVQIGKSGMSKSADAEAVGRLISLSLRHGADIVSVIKQLESLSGEDAVYSEGELIRSVPDAIAKVLRRKFLSKDSKPKLRLIAQEPVVFTVGKHNIDCPEGEELCDIITENGCEVCRECGWSRC